MTDTNSYIMFRIKFILPLVLILLCSTQLLSNTAQPGIWNAGGMGGFTLLFPEDSLAYQKIQMQEEKISIQLYKGFAVVKGEYWMYNETEQDISMRSGYPIDASYETEKRGYTLTEMHFDTLYQLQVNIDGKAVEKNKIRYEAQTLHPKLDLGRIQTFGYEDEAKWYVWDCTYKAKSTTKIEVYFILETNNASILEGYDKNYHNGFIYVLATGATWKPPIGKGSISVELKDGLGIRDIHGISPNSIFLYDEKRNILTYQFTNLEPTKEDNIAITYHERMDDFDFPKVLDSSNDYFREINQLSSKDIRSNDFVTMEFDSPFSVPDRTAMTLGVVLIIMIGVGILLLVGIFFIIRKLFRKLK